MKLRAIRPPSELTLSELIAPGSPRKRFVSTPVTVFHTLTPRNIVYVIHSDRGAYFKLKIDGYYDEAGTPAIITLRYAPVLAP